MKACITISLILLSLCSQAQFKTNVTATGKHKYWLGQPKRTKAQIIARKQQLESYRAYLKIKQEFDHKFDSTKVTYLDSIYVQKEYDLTFKTDSIWSGLPDSLVHDFKKTPDSLWCAQKIIASGDLPPEAVRMLTNPPRMPSAAQLKAQIRDYKEAMQIRKKYNEAYRHGKNYYLDSIYMQRNVSFELKKDMDWTGLPDSIAYNYRKADSLWVGQKVLNNGDFPPEAVHYLTNPPPNPKEVLLDQIDSTKYQYTPEDLETFAGMMSGDIPLGEQASPDPVTAFGGGPQNPNAMGDAVMMAQMAMTDPDEFAEQQVRERLLKNKFTELPDRRKPEEGTKRNSLEKASLRDRIYFGGNLNVTSTDPFIVDFGLQLGYWIKVKWLAGVGFTFREQFDQRNTLLTGDSWGRSVFSRYDLPKDFFAYTELEQKINESLFSKPKQDEGLTQPEWQQAWLAGLGKEFNIRFLRMQIMLLYDFTWRTNDMYSRPFVTKLGFQFTRKPRIGRGK